MALELDDELQVAVAALHRVLVAVVELADGGTAVGQFERSDDAGEPLVERLDVFEDFDRRHFGLARAEFARELLDGVLKRRMDGVRLRVNGLKVADVVLVHEPRREALAVAVRVRQEGREFCVEFGVADGRLDGRADGRVAFELCSSAESHLKRNFVRHRIEQRLVRRCRRRRDLVLLCARQRGELIPQRRLERRERPRVVDAERVDVRAAALLRALLGSLY